MKYPIRYSTLDKPYTNEELREIYRPTTMNNPYDHRPEFLPLNKNRFFPPSYAEIHRLKIQRNWGWTIAGILAVIILLMMVES